MQYKFQIFHQNDNFKIDDVFIDFVEASSIHEARSKIEEAFPISKKYSCFLMND